MCHGVPGSLVGSARWRVSARALCDVEQVRFRLCKAIVVVECVPRAEAALLHSSLVCDSANKMGAHRVSC